MLESVTGILRRMVVFGAVNLGNAYKNVPWLVDYVQSGLPFLHGVIRNIGYWLCQQLAIIIDQLMRAVSSITGLSLFDRLTGFDAQTGTFKPEGAIQGLETTLRSWFLPLLLLAVAVTGIMFMLYQLKTAKKSALGILIALLVFIATPFIFVSMRSFTKAAIGDITTEENIGAKILASSTVDVNLSYVKGFMNAENKDGVYPENLVTMDAYYKDPNMDGSEDDTLSVKNIYSLDVSRTISKKVILSMTDLNAIGRKAAWDSFAHGKDFNESMTKEFLETLNKDAMNAGITDEQWPYKYRIEKIERNDEGEPVKIQNNILIDASLFGSGFNEGIFRYSYRFLETFLILLILVFALMSMLLKVARMTYELVFKKIILAPVVATDFGSGRWKIILGEIANTYIVFIVNMLLLQLFIPIAASIALREGLFKDGAALGTWIIRIVCILGLAFLLIDGPDVIKKLFGVDAGIDGALGPIVLAHMAAGAGKRAGRTVAGAFGAPMRARSLIQREKGNQVANQRWKDFVADKKSGMPEKKRAMEEARYRDFADDESNNRKQKSSEMFDDKYAAFTDDKKNRMPEKRKEMEAARYRDFADDEKNKRKQKSAEMFDDKYAAFTDDKKSGMPEKRKEMENARYRDFADDERNNRPRHRREMEDYRYEKYLDEIGEEEEKHERARMFIKNENNAKKRFEEHQEKEKE